MATKTTRTTRTTATSRKTTKAKIEAPMIVKTKIEAPLATAAPRLQPTHDQIAKRAYEIFAGRGYTHGRHEQDWFEAERELHG